MAIKLNTSYSKKLGLPGFSSHAFSASVEVELGDINQVAAECGRLYGLLQASVDHEIRNTGFVPDDAYGTDSPQPAANGARALPPGTPSHNGNGSGSNGSEPWNCSPKQRDLILKIIEENGLVRDNIDGLAHQRFGVGLTRLNKLQASGLIDELFESYGNRSKSRGSSNGNRQQEATNGGRQ